MLEGLCDTIRIAWLGEQVSNRYVSYRVAMGSENLGDKKSQDATDRLGKCYIESLVALVVSQSGLVLTSFLVKEQPMAYCQLQGRAGNGN